ncbi:Uncharacterized protein XB16_0848 [Leptospira santarosai]|uniref:Uncharacterized protein n=1 Tax=Leptospira santarosai TaxID=28183 RepID=A0A2P1QQJ8_9LEPT|nr:Uncharacterized protein XB16_0848 [Leptospira santarosai]
MREEKSEPMHSSLQEMGNSFFHTFDHIFNACEPVRLFV